MRLDELPGKLASIGVALDAERLPLFERLRDEVLAANAQANVTRIIEPLEFVEKHLLDALAGLVAGPAPDVAARFVDVGSGAGFPGLPVAIARPGWQVVLIESVLKKARIIEEAARALGLPNVTVLARRAEEVGRDPAHRETADRATVRAVGSVAECLEYALPLVRVGGKAILYRGPSAGAEAELGQAAEVGRKLANATVSGFAYELPTGGSRRLIIVEKHAATPDTWPRRPGMAAKRPLA
jgi:16S rRNA (guanine527-N7)-methyltransferase